MNCTWILVADRARARIVVKPKAVPGRSCEWQELEPLVYPEARIPDRTLSTDKPGRTFDRKGFGPHAMATEVSAKEEAAERFAKTLARVLDKGRTNHLYESLVLVAEPGFLGTLQANLSAQTAKKVVDKIPKDLTTRPYKTLAQDLRALLRLHA